MRPKISSKTYRLVTLPPKRRSMRDPRQSRSAARCVAARRIVGELGAQQFQVVLGGVGELDAEAVGLDVGDQGGLIHFAAERR